MRRWSSAIQGRGKRASSWLEMLKEGCWTRHHKVEPLCASPGNPALPNTCMACSSSKLRLPQGVEVGCWAHCQADKAPLSQHSRQLGNPLGLVPACGLTPPILVQLRLSCQAGNMAVFEGSCRAEEIWQEKGIALLIS